MALSNANILCINMLRVALSQIFSAAYAANFTQSRLHTLAVAGFLRFLCSQLRSSHGAAWLTHSQDNASVRSEIYSHSVPTRRKLRLNPIA